MPSKNVQTHKIADSGHAQPKNTNPDEEYAGESIDRRKWRVIFHLPVWWKSERKDRRAEED